MTLTIFAAIINRCILAFFCISTKFNIETEYLVSDVKNETRKIEVYGRLEKYSNSEKHYTMRFSVHINLRHENYDIAAIT